MLMHFIISTPNVSDAVAESFYLLLHATAFVKVLFFLFEAKIILQVISIFLIRFRVICVIILICLFKQAGRNVMKYFFTETVEADLI